MIIHDKSGSMMVEVLVSLAIFAVLAAGVIGIFVSASTSEKEAAEYVAASGLVHEGIEAVRSIRSRNYSEVSSGAHGLATTSGYYTFSGSSESAIGGKYTRVVTVEDVYRDTSLLGDIAASGVADSESKKVTVSVSWDTLTGKTINLSSEFYVFDY